MSKSTLPWFRFYTETISDTKFDVIAVRLGCSKVSLIGTWAILLSLASKSPNRGSLSITMTIPYSLEDLAAICGMDLERLDEIVNEFLDLEMLEIVDGCLFIKNWNKRQFESDNSTERVNDWRERNNTVTETLHDRYSNNNAILPDTDTDTDTDLKEEEEEGKNPQNSSEINIFKAYEQEIGPITPMIAEDLKLLEAEHPPDWIVAAFKVAANNGKRNLAYPKAILKRWKVDGYGTDNRRAPPGGNGHGPTETPGQKLLREQRERNGLSP